ncbi:MAG: family 10 glycosylhydrolase [Candidatus Omnitrophica bacterium]|nr:family 10 glycosylhydrolase [Candidatus Omnitrophota bacterium]
MISIRRAFLYIRPPQKPMAGSVFRPRNHWLQLMRASFSIIIFLIMPLSAHAKDKFTPVKGVWVTCFSEKKVLYSKKSAFELIKFCKKSEINEIYLQLYRIGKSYYDTKINGKASYEGMLKSANGDTIDVILKEAKRCNIEVFAWINVLSVGKTRKTDIVERFGEDILTKDQYLRSPMRTEDINESDKYYLRDEQLFLEPGDPRVAEYVVSIIDEIITRYPDLSGAHLDYVRYPYPVPFIPRSSFNKFGLTYGYAKENINRFKEKTGLDPLSMNYDNENSLLWDNWKRGQVTELVGKLAMAVKNKSPGMVISCAVIASTETAFSVAFQDWPGWLENGIVDYVVLMNYTKNNQLAKEITKSALAHRGNGKVYIGIGNFLMKDDPKLLSEQERIVESLNPDGIAYFSYDFL